MVLSETTQFSSSTMAYAAPSAKAFRANSFPLKLSPFKAKKMLFSIIFRLSVQTLGNSKKSWWMSSIFIELMYKKSPDIKCQDFAIFNFKNLSYFFAANGFVLRFGFGTYPRHCTSKSNIVGSHVLRQISALCWI